MILDLDEMLQWVFIFLLIPSKIISHFLNFNPILVYIFLLISCFVLFTGISLSPIPLKKGRYYLKDLGFIIIILIIPSIIITYILKQEILLFIIYGILSIILLCYVFKKVNKNIIELI